MTNNIDYSTLLQVNNRIKLLIEYLRLKKAINQGTDDGTGNT